MKPRELPVSYFDLKVNARFHRSDAVPVPPSAMDLLDLCRKAERSPIKTSTVRKVVEDWTQRDGRHALLVNRADSDRTDVALVSYDDGSRRMAGKRVNDGIEYSCHILISPPSGQRMMPLVLVTGGAGMSRDQVTNLLNTLLRRAADDPSNALFFERPHPNGEHARKAKLRCSFELLPHQSMMLTEVLSRGLLNEVQLVAHEFQGIDQHFVQKAHSVTIGVAQEGTPLAWAAFRNAMKATRVNADQLVLKFKDPESGKPTSKTIAYGDLERAMTRRDVITFDTDLMPRYTKVSSEIVLKLKGLL